MSSHLIFFPNKKELIEKFGENYYFFATYDLEGAADLRSAAWELAIGQSVGNPNQRNRWETDDLFLYYSVKILADEADLKNKKRGKVEFAFPSVNLNFKEDGISQLLCHLMGGQTDINNIVRCRLLELELTPHMKTILKGPKFGIPKIREFTGVPQGTPLLGGILKPKVLPTLEMLLSIVQELVEGGVNFIKEDEIFANPDYCPIEQRVPAIMELIRNSGRNVVYCVCINGDSEYALERVRTVHRLGGNGIHINFWSSFGIYKSIRDLDLPIFMHGQTSGSRILTDSTHRFSIDFKIICDLMSRAGCDFLHCGMVGGYGATTNDEVLEYMDVLRKNGTIPTLSCGFHQGNVDYVRSIVKNDDFMCNSGGAIHAHPLSTLGGTRAFREAIDKTGRYKEEFRLAIEKWGYVKPEEY